MMTGDEAIFKCTLCGREQVHRSGCNAVCQTDGRPMAEVAKKIITKAARKPKRK